MAGTDWDQIVGLYDLLLRVEPSPVIALNRAVAFGLSQGPRVGLTELDTVLRTGALDTYALAHAARAEMLRKLGQTGAAQASLRRALELTRQPAERRLLQRRLADVEQKGAGL